MKSTESVRLHRLKYTIHYVFMCVHQHSQHVWHIHSVAACTGVKNCSHSKHTQQGHGSTGPVRPVCSFYIIQHSDTQTGWLVAIWGGGVCGKIVRLTS